MDSYLKLDHAYNVYDQEALTWILNSQKADSTGNPVFLKMNITKEWLPPFLLKLWKNGHSSLIVEGGAKFLSTFIEEGYWDEARVFINPEKYFENGIEAPLLKQKPSSTIYLGSDALNYYYHYKIWEQ